MEPGEYEAMAAAEEGMWWYRAAHANLLLAFGAIAGRGGRLLDAGCGTGGLLRRLAGPAQGWTRIGLDIAPAALAHAREKAAARVVAGSVNQLPFATGALDTIFSVDVLCHRAVDPDAALAEMARCLAPGGRLILNLPAYDWLMSRHDARVHNARRYHKAAVAGLLRAQGLRPLRLTYWNTLLFPALVLQRKLFAADGDGASDVRPYPPVVEGLFSFLTGIERRLLDLGLDLPFGGSILAIAEKP